MTNGRERDTERETRTERNNAGQQSAGPLREFLISAFRKEKPPTGLADGAYGERDKVR